MKDLSIAWIIGLMVGIVLVVVLLKAMNKNGKAKTEYDERQQIERGKAYKYGFFAMLLTCAALIFLDTFETVLPFLGMLTYFLPILAGVVVQFSYSIFHDAYEGLNTNMGRFTVILIAISALNIVIAVIRFVRGGMIEDGKLCSQFLNLLVGIMCLIVGIELLIKKAIDAKEGCEES